MGRGGYNGGTPTVNNPKENTVYVFPFRESHLEIPKDSQILKAGECLQNPRGGVQPEFGYIIGTVVANAKQEAPSKLTSKIKRTKKVTKDTKEIPYRWIAASGLLEHAPELARNYHLKHPTEPKPYGFDDKVTAAS